MTETDPSLPGAAEWVHSSRIGLLTEAVHALHGVQQPTEILQTLVGYGMRLVDARGGGYGYLDGGDLQAACCTAGKWCSLADGLSQQSLQAWAGQVSEPAICNGSPGDSPAFSLLLPGLDLKSRISLPLKTAAKSVSLGFVELYDKRDAAGFDTMDQELLVLLASTAVAALELARMSKTLHQSASDLVLSNDRLSRSQQLAGIGSWDWDIESGELYWSEQIAPLFGHPPGMLKTTYENFLAAIHRDDRRLVEQALRACIEAGEPYAIERRVVWPDGSVRWVLEKGDVERDAQGQPKHMLGIVADITGRKEAELVLRSERDFAEALINTAQMIVLVLDTEGRIVRFNPYLEEISGYRLEEVQGKDWHECFLPMEEREGSRRLFRRGVSSVQTRGQVSPLFTRNGELREIDWYYKTLKDADNRVVGLLATGREITQRLLMENALRDSEERFRGLVESTSDWIWEINELGVYTYVSPQVEQILGYPAHSLIGKPPFELMPGAEARRVRGEFLLNVSRHLPIDRLENVNRHADGHEVVLETSGVPFFDRHGSFRGYRGIDRDVTARKQAERALHEQTLRSQLILENSHDGLLVLNLDSTLREVNDAYCRLVGYRREELLEMSVAELDVLDDRQAIAQRIERIMTHGSEQFETRHRRRDGELVDLDVSATLAAVGDDRFLFAFCRDITERRQREQQRLQGVRAQRDTLVKEIHHRIKNHLQGVTNLLRNHARDHPQLAAVMDTAIGQVSSIAQVHGLQSRLNGGRIELRALLEVICGAIDTLASARIVLALDSHASKAFVRPSDAVALALVINELLQNAVKHLPSERQHGAVGVELAGDGERVLLLIRNPSPGPLPQGFDLKRGVGLGTGLTLVQDLLPHQGAELSLERVQGEVLTRLTLGAPVISLE